MNAFNDAWNLLKLSPNEFNIDSDEGNKRFSFNNQMRDNRSAESYSRGGETDEEFRNRNPLPQDIIDQELSSTEVTPRDDPGRVRREGPVPKKDILQEALEMARRRPPQKPLEIENLPPETTQTKLPEELTAGATVGDRDFRDVKWPRLR